MSRSIYRRVILTINPGRAIDRAIDTTIGEV